MIGLFQLSLFATLCALILTLRLLKSKSSTSCSALTGAHAATQALGSDGLPLRSTVAERAAAYAAADPNPAQLNRPDVPTSSPSLLAALRSVVGKAHVRADKETLAVYARSTTSSSTTPIAIVTPANQAEVEAIVKIASDESVAIYPLSTGRNWGYGDACAVGNGQLIIELSRMNRILEVEPDLAYVVLEPGVTQYQLSSYLIEHYPHLQADCTGAGPDTSIVGNIMERGFGHSPNGDRFRNVSGIRIVLADGSVLNTGFGHYANAKSAHVFPYGVGPTIDGIFTQSNMGIVVSIGVWLMPKSECVEHFIIHVQSQSELGRVIDELRPLRMSGILPSVVHIGNDLRMLSANNSFPRDINSTSRLSDELRADMRKQAGLHGEWVVSGALYGSNRFVALARSEVKAAMKRSGAKHTIRILTVGLLEWGTFFHSFIKNTNLGKKLTMTLDLGKEVFAMNRGIPASRFLNGGYWRNRMGIPTHPKPEEVMSRAMETPTNRVGIDPAADNCGFLWASPVIPMRGRDVNALVECIRPIFQEYGFDLMATLSMINARALSGVLTIAYDKDDAEETQRAQRAYKVLFDTLMNVGYIPYRVGIPSMHDLDPTNGNDVYWKTVQKLKEALDPKGIISPGRYQPAQAKIEAEGRRGRDSLTEQKGQ